MVTMLTDLVSRYDVAAIQLESPGYMGFLHGYHHEIIGADLDEVQQRLLAVSFNPVELEGAREAGIDAERLRARVAALLDGCWNRGVAVKGGDAPSAEAQALFDDAEFGAYVAWQQAQVASLSAAIRDAVKRSSPRTEIRHFASLDGGEAGNALIATGDGILAGYASSEDDALRRADAFKPYGKKIFGMIRAIAPDMTNPAAVAPRVEAWRQSGVDGVDIYNYGLMPGVMWDAVAAALRGDA
jgi:hypothetical protein